MIDPERLVSAYASGWFPMAVEGGEIRWFSPDPRGIIPLDTFQISNRLARTWRSGRFEIAVDRSFPEVMSACATVPRDPQDPGTWISQEIVDSYTALHRVGVAHSVETWRRGQLVGGLYGVSLGGAFFGESMFHRETDASKVALVALVERLNSRGFQLLDTQWSTAHLEQFGAVEIPRREYLRRLERALRSPATFV
jgi:leucyl/phenylalanyl-tRNA--protein transferase